MQEYVLTISVRDKEHPLKNPEKILIELGFPKDTPRQVIDGSKQMAELIRLLGSPEAVAEFMVRNEVAKQQILQAKQR